MRRRAKLFFCMCCLTPLLGMPTQAQDVSEQPSANWNVRSRAIPSFESQIARVDSTVDDFQRGSILLSVCRDWTHRWAFNAGNDPEGLRVLLKRIDQIDNSKMACECWASLFRLDRTIQMILEIDRSDILRQYRNQDRHSGDRRILLHAILQRSHYGKGIYEELHRLGELDELEAAVSNLGNSRADVVAKCHFYFSPLVMSHLLAQDKFDQLDHFIDSVPKPHINLVIKWLCQKEFALVVYDRLGKTIWRRLDDAPDPESFEVVLKNRMFVRWLLKSGLAQELIPKVQRVFDAQLSSHVIACFLDGDQIRRWCLDHREPIDPEVPRAIQLSARQKGRVYRVDYHRYTGSSQRSPLIWMGGIDLQQQLALVADDRR